MGELTQKTHTFVMPQGGTYSFAMNFDYDSWNRTRSITYADGEHVNMINSTYQDKSDSLYQMLERGWTCSGFDPENVTLDPELQTLQNLKL